MKGSQAEKYLGFLYSLSAVLSLISGICVVTVWQYWAWTLDGCISVDCGCILYGVNTFSTFMGGDVKICHFTTYATIPTILIGIFLGFYHSYRSCIGRSLGEPKTLTTGLTYHEGRGDVVVVTPKGRAPCKQWMPPTFLAALICCLALAHAVVITDGYYESCRQYKKYLIRSLGSRGREADAIHNRLTCGAIFDYMDYIHPDANNWRRGDVINTALALQSAIATSWFNFFTWLIIFSINFIMARQRRRSAGEKFCCCN